jgi:hypothetical protein
MLTELFFLATCEKASFVKLVQYLRVMQEPTRVEHHRKLQPGCLLSLKYLVNLKINFSRRKSFKANMARCGSTVVKHLPQHPKAEGSSPSALCLTGFSVSKNI